MHIKYKCVCILHSHKRIKKQVAHLNLSLWVAFGPKRRSEVVEDIRQGHALACSSSAVSICRFVLVKQVQ